MTEGVLLYLIPIIIVLIIIVLICKRLFCKQVRFGPIKVREFDIDDPPMMCGSTLASLKNRSLGWMRINMPSSYRNLSDRQLPDYEFTDAEKLLPPPPSLEDELSGDVQLRHRPYQAFSIDSHVPMMGSSFY